MAVNVPISVTDEMTAPLMKITSALDTVISSFRNVEGVSSGAMASATADIRAAEASLSTMNTKVATTTSTMTRATAKSNGFVSSIKSMVGMVGGLYAVQKSFSLISSSLESVQNRTQQETKLATIMQQRMKTGNISGVTSIMKNQSKTGVIGTTTQMQGAQQMATFLNQKKSLETLIPAMNNLAVQQHGVNATGDDMKNIGNMVGKVMQGQTGALRRVGISFTSAEEKALKYGNEQKRAATLAQIITNNVGNMNQAIAKTPQGQMAQMKNNLAAVKLQIGQAIMPNVIRLISVLSRNIPAISTMASGFAVIVSGVAGALTGIVKVVTDVINYLAKLFGKKADFQSMSKVVEFLTKAFVAGATALMVYKGALAIATIAQKGFGIAMKIASFNPIILGIMAAIVAITLLVTHWKQVKGAFITFGTGIKGWFTDKFTAATNAAKRAFHGFMTSDNVIIKTIRGYLGGFITFITGVFTGNWKKAWSGVVQIFASIFGGITAVAKAPLNGMIALVNLAISGLNKLSVKIPKYVPKVGGKTFGFNISHIPYLATGTNNFGGGTAVVGERGPEIVNLPPHSTVTPNNKIGSSKTIVVNKLADTIVVREEADIDKVASKLADKLEDIEDDVA